MSLRKNLLLNSEKAEKDFIQRKADTLIEAFQLTALSKTKATALSGGETARMCLARLMMKDYAFLILDEPCAAMDIESTLQTELLIKEYCHKTNTCCLLITHSLSQAKRLADDVLFLHHGQLLEYGPTDSLLNHPVHPETKRFLEFFGQQTV